VRSGVAEDLAQQVRRTIDHRGLTGEPGCGGHEPDHLHHPDDRVEPHQRVNRDQRVEGAGAGQLLRGLEVELGADLAGGDHLAVHQWYLARGEHQRTGAYRGYICPGRRGHRGQRDPEFGEPTGPAHDFGRLR